MNAAKTPGYPYPNKLHEHLDSLISDVLSMQEQAVHPEGHGAGAVILFVDTDGVVLTFTGHSVRNRDENVRICAEKNAYDKLSEALASGLEGYVLAIGIAAAVRRNKDLLSWLLGARPPCESCRSMLHMSEHFADETPVVMVNKDRSLVIHQLKHIRKIYDQFPD